MSFLEPHGQDDLFFLKFKQEKFVSSTPLRFEFQGFFFLSMLKPGFLPCLIKYLGQKVKLLTNYEASIVFETFKAIYFRNDKLGQQANPEQENVPSLDTKHALSQPIIVQ